jgi:hypothetical protein
MPIKNTVTTGAQGAATSGRYEQSAALDREVEQTLQYWVTGIVTHDRKIIERIHDEDFYCTELGGPMDRRTHIEMELRTAEVEMEFFDLTTHGFGEIVLTWGRQTLKAAIPAESFNDCLVRQARDGLEFSFTLVWRRDEAGLRVLTFHASPIDSRPGGN